MAEDALVVWVPYTPIWLDWHCADGTYTPAQLRKAGLVVRHGEARRYELWWPGGATEPPHEEPRRRKQQVG